MPQSQLWALVGLAVCALLTSRYRCPLHDQPLQFDTDHWVCPDGHETLLAIDTREHEIVELRANGIQWGAYPVTTDSHA
jgi:hypothetical protein